MAKKVEEKELGSRPERLVELYGLLAEIYDEVCVVKRQEKHRPFCALISVHAGVWNTHVIAIVIDICTHRRKMLIQHNLQFALLTLHVIKAARVLPDEFSDARPLQWCVYSSHTLRLGWGGNWLCICL